MLGPDNRYLLYASQVYALAILRPLQEAIRRRGGESAWFFDGPGEQYLRSDEPQLHTIEEVRHFAPAAVFVPGNVVPDFFPGVKVEVFHGFSVGKRSEERGHFRIRGFFDLYCTQGRSTTEPFRELAEQHGHFRVVETGWPKMDPLFRDPETPSPWRSGWNDNGLPLVLYASTFTEYLSSARTLVDTIRQESVRGRWNWLVTMHPKMPDEVVTAYRGLEGPHLRFVETDDIVPLLRAADAMVSDTSSVVFEFLLQHRPVVTFRNARPGPYLIDARWTGELAEAIERALSRPEPLIRRIAEFAEAIHPYRDGQSSERVLDATERLVEDGLDGLAPKPLNLWRKLQMRKRLGHYRWN
jgi:CDP-glycerol glycerophosphotransferase (TagB/SpsB family)